MTRIVQFTLEDGSETYVEVDEPAPLGPQPVARGGLPEVAEAPRSFERALAQVRPAVERVIETFRQVSRPDEVSVEFGLTFKSKVGAFIFTADQEATFKVSIKWSGGEQKEKDEST
jgi:hypothetical protein